jgi:hypothetical protein
VVLVFLNLAAQIFNRDQLVLHYEIDAKLLHTKGRFLQARLAPNKAWLLDAADIGFELVKRCFVVYVT